MPWPPFSDEIGQSPGPTREAALEVTTTDEKQARLYPRASKGLASELGDRTCSGPLVGCNNQSHLHLQSIAK